MNRTQWILVAALAAQVLVIALTGAPFARSGEAAASRPLLPALESFTPQRIEVLEGGERNEDAGRTGANERSVALRRAGEGWALENPDGYPVDGEKVTKVLTNLRELRVRRPVLTTSRYHEALEVSDNKYARRLRLWDAPSGEPKVDLLLGTSPNYRTRHGRLRGDDLVYELRGLEYYDLQPDAGSWIEKKLLDIPEGDIVGLTLRNRHGSFELQRKDGEWVLAEPARAGNKLDRSAVESFVRSVASLWLSEPAGRVDPPAQGFADPAATLELRYQRIREDKGSEAPSGTAPTPTFETELQVASVRIGSQLGQDDKRRYASRAGFDYAAIVSEYEAEKLTEKELADLYAED
jgi:hypothetical protein